VLHELPGPPIRVCPTGTNISGRLVHQGVHCSTPADTSLRCATRVGVSLSRRELSGKHLVPGGSDSPANQRSTTSHSIHDDAGGFRHGRRVKLRAFSNCNRSPNSIAGESRSQNPHLAPFVVFMSAVDEKGALHGLASATEDARATLLPPVPSAIFPSSGANRLWTIGMPMIDLGRSNPAVRI